MGTWTTTAQGLPGEDEAVQFMIGTRSVPLHGLYRRGEFETRWWRYPAWSVERWSVIDRDARFTSRASSTCAFDPLAAAT